MNQEIDNSREKAIIINVLLNLLALIPAVITAILILLSVANGKLDEVLMIGYPIIAALLMTVVNLRYCLKYSVVCFVQWWFIMCLISGGCFIVQNIIYEIMPQKFDQGIIFFLVEYVFAVIAITVFSVVCQIILPIARSRKRTATPFLEYPDEAQ